MNHLALCVLGMSFCFIPHALGAESGADFQGKTIRWIIPFRTGGGSDEWSRFTAPFLEKYLPGNPRVEVVNRPGGGSTRGANAFAATAKPDGLMLLGTSASTQFPYLLGDRRVRYDYRNWRPLLVYQTGGVVYVAPSIFAPGQPKNINSLLKGAGARLVYGSQGPTSLDLVPVLSFKLLGLDVKSIFGIRGRGAGRLAFERGDTTIDFQTSAAYLRNVTPLVRAGKAIPLYSLGALNESGQAVRDPAFPNLPHLVEVYEDLNGFSPRGVEWESWYALLSAGFSAQKVIVVPRETPAHIIAAYTNAFVKMKQDPQYLATKDKVIGAYDQFVDDEASKLYQLSTDLPQRQKSWIKAWLKDEYGLKL